MLRSNAKIWAIVVLICIIVQFITVSLPTISESFAQMDSVFEQRVVEEKAKAEALKTNKTDGLDAEKIEDIGYMSDGNMAEENVTIENVAQTTIESESEESTPSEIDSPTVIFLFVFIFILFLVVLTTAI